MNAGLCYYYSEINNKLKQNTDDLTNTIMPRKLYIFTCWIKCILREFFYYQAGTKQHDGGWPNTQTWASWANVASKTEMVCNRLEVSMKTILLCWNIHVLFSIKKILRRVHASIFVCCVCLLSLRRNKNKLKTTQRRFNKYNCATLTCCFNIYKLRVLELHREFRHD